MLVPPHTAFEFESSYTLIRFGLKIHKVMAKIRSGVFLTVRAMELVLISHLHDPSSIQWNSAVPILSG